MRVARHGDGWVILYSDRDERLQIAFVDTRGTVLETRALPREIDGDTADLATNARGVFVTWVDGNRVRSSGIDGSVRALEAAGSRPSETRASGDATSCVVAWTVDDGKRARIARSTDCP